jgi:hypothetical protein
VLGCIYGNRRYPNQLFGEEAYKHILTDIAQPDNFIDAYILSEEIVLAAGSLFHGEVFNGDNGSCAEELFETAYRGLIDSAMPGCIVVNDQNNLPVCLVYIFAGRIVGIFSHRDGWLNTQYETGLRYVAKTRNARVCASMLAARNTQEVNNITFSLSGLADRASEPWAGVLRYELSNSLYVNYNKEEIDKMKVRSALNKFVHGTINPAANLNRSFVVRSAFKVHP